MAKCRGDCYSRGSIVTNSITAQQIAANTITGNELVAGTVSARHLAANSVGATHIQTRSLSADKLNIGTLSAISSNIGTVTAGTIRGTTISGNNISGNNISGGTINGTTITGTTITGATISGGTIRGARLEAATGKFTGTLEVESLIGSNVLEVRSIPVKLNHGQESEGGETHRYKDYTQTIRVKKASIERHYIILGSRYSGIIPAHLDHIINFSFREWSDGGLHPSTSGIYNGKITILLIATTSAKTVSY